MRYCWLLLLALAVASCATNVQRSQSVSANLTPDVSIYVPLCADGLHDGHRQVASGLMTSQLLGAELKTQVQHVKIGEREESRQLSLISAREQGFMYVAYPSILDWQNEATPMASVPDKVKVRIDIVDVASATVIDTVVLQNQTGRMATSKIPPQELLASPLKEYVEALLQPKENTKSFWEEIRTVF